MKHAPMRFCGLSLHHNPEKLTLSGRDHLKEYLSPCCEADSESLYRELYRVTGEGEFYGKDCMNQYKALERLQLLRQRGKLVLPDRKPLYAYLKELSLTAKPVDSVLSYRFVFVEAQSPRRHVMGTPDVYLAKDGESLWDIAYAYNMPIERLVTLNPQIALIDALSEGEKVKLC
jgi:hypothetical protein